MQPLAILFGATVTAATAYNLGALLLRTAAADPGIRFVTGAALLSSLVFALCALGLAFPPAFLAIGGAGMIAARRSLVLPQRPKLTRWSLLHRFLTIRWSATVLLALAAAAQAARPGI